jgi:hypothetical protein
VVDVHHAEVQWEASGMINVEKQCMYGCEDPPAQLCRCGAAYCKLHAGAGLCPLCVREERLALDARFMLWGAKFEPLVLPSLWEYEDRNSPTQEESIT